MEINQDKEYQARMDDLYCEFGEVCNGRSLNEIFAVTTVFLRDVHRMLQEANPDVPSLISALTTTYTMIEAEEKKLEDQENE